MQSADVDVSAMAAESLASLLQGAPERDVCMKITPSSRVWAHGEVGQGATFSFTLGAGPGEDESA